MAGGVREQSVHQSAAENQAGFEAVCPPRIGKFCVVTLHDGAEGLVRSQSLGASWMSSFQQVLPPDNRP
jgi:hypothetical protein